MAHGLHRRRQEPKVAFVVVDLAWAFVNVALSWLLIELYGISGAGIAFFASYAFHTAVIYPVVRRMTGFAWSSDNVRTGLALVGLASAAFLACWHLPASVGFVVGLMGPGRELRALAARSVRPGGKRGAASGPARTLPATAPAMNIRSFLISVHRQPGLLPDEHVYSAMEGWFSRGGHHGLRWMS